MRFHFLVYFFVVKSTSEDQVKSSVFKVCFFLNRKKGKQLKDGANNLEFGISNLKFGSTDHQKLIKKENFK